MEILIEFQAVILKERLPNNITEDRDQTDDYLSLLIIYVFVNLTGIYHADFLYF